MGARCSGGGGGCDGREDGAVEALVQWQKVSDFLIGASYLSIPLELLHFATCADLAPLRWVLLQFGAFIVLCGAAHLLAVFTYSRPDSRRLLVVLTAAKALAAVAASVAAVSLPTFVPQLLRLKTREALLRDKARQLHRDVAIVRRREETAARVVRAVTRHIRRGVAGGGGGGASPSDVLAVMRTAVFHLADELGLSGCAVWMPAAKASDDDDDGSSLLLRLVHQLPLLPEDDEHQGQRTIRVTDPDVAAVMASKDAMVLRPGSALGTPYSGHGRAAAAIRMPMLRASNFVADASSSSGLSSDVQQGAAAVSYAIMVLVLPAPAPATTKSHRGAGEWGRQELEIVEVVADQLAVALSHAAVLEEWQQTRHRLAERQRAVAQARHDASVAAGARDAAQGAMRDGVLRPMHAVAGLLSLMQAQQQQQQQGGGAVFRCASAEQRVAVDAMARISATLSSTLVDDVMAALLTPTEAAVAAGVSLARRPFDPRALVKDAAGVAACLARCRGLGFSHRVEMSALPAECLVVGDDRRVFHLLLHMLGVLLDRCECHCHDLCFAVDTVTPGDQETTMSGSGLPSPNFSGCNTNTVCVRFRFGITRLLKDSLLLSSSPRPHQERIARSTSTGISSVSSETRLSIAMCNKIVQMMNGKMWQESTSEPGGQHGDHMSLILHFQLGYGVASPSASSPSGGGGGGFYRFGGRFGAPSPSTTAPPLYNFNGLRILLSDSDGTSREVTRKLLERLGCQVLPVPSAAHCLSLLLGTTAGGDQPAFQFTYLQLQAVLLDLHTPVAASADAAATAMDDGFEVALRIREVTGDRFSWLLILVALPLPPRASCIDVRDVCKRTGVNGVIHKPITLPALAAELYRVLHNDN